MANRPFYRITTAIFVGIVCANFANSQGPQAETKPVAASKGEFVFKADSSWKPSHFGGDGPIEMIDGVLKLGFGDPLTGVRWEGEFPKVNYEVTLQARRTGGFDFFCGLTLPVEDQRCSLVLGGWGGSLVGISCIDGLDASNNETMMIQNFEKDRWYRIRMRVTTDKITAWLDDDEIIDVDRAGHVFDIRGEMEESTPVGVAAFQCESEIKNFVVRELEQVAK